LAPQSHSTLGLSLLVAGPWEEARAQYEASAASGGETGALPTFMTSGAAMGLTGDEIAGHAVRFARVMGARDPEAARVLGPALTDGSIDEEQLARARESVATLIADSVLTLQMIAGLYTRLGDHDTALDWLETLAGGGSLSAGIVGVDPALDPLRDDPRMQALMDELGLPNGYDPATDTYEPEGTL
jgi:hypothetical protein